MKKISKLFIPMMITTIALSSCGGKNAYQKFVDKVYSSTKEAKTVEVSIIAKDGEVEVYNEKQQITITKVDQKNSYVIETTVKELNETGDYVEETKEEIVSSEEAKSLVNLDLNKKNFTSYSINKDVLEGVTDASKAKTLLKIDNFSCIGEVKLSFTLIDNQLSNYICAYTSTSHFEMSINTIYTY